jgi:hypothetical protein
MQDVLQHDSSEDAGDLKVREMPRRRRAGAPA